MKNKFYGVLGLGRSGNSTVEFLHKNNIRHIAWDDSCASSNHEKNIIDISDPIWQTIDCLLISPGIPTTYPKPHPLVPLLKKKNIPIVCDIELLYRNNSNARFVGITGTNGKSTTTALIGHILKENNIRTCIGGNIGTGALSLPSLDKDGVYVIETSSYQLELLDQAHFNVAIMLNITPDHLERHNNMENYAAAKCNIFNHQGKHDCAIISVDNMLTKKIYEDLVRKNAIGNIVPFSTKHILENGISIINGFLTCNVIKKYEMQLPELPYLKGEHNAENIAASFIATLFLGLSPDKIIKAIESFSGLDHRLQLVGKLDDIEFYNDSKATNAESTEKALLSFPDNIYWIAGGQAKHGGIKSLAPLFSRIKHAFLIGEAEEEFATELDGKVPYTKCKMLSNAFDQATKLALKDKSGTKIILLSPACASWDQWKSFEERGAAFCEMTKKSIDENRNI